MSPELKRWVAPRIARVEAALRESFASVEPAPFREACRYPLLTGGKRIRPLLVFAGAEAVAGPESMYDPGVSAAALAVELLHTYSLVHDDLPAMDDDDLRRGRPTVHVVYGEATAILVGDALLTEAFVVLAGSGPLVGELAKAAGAEGMVGGQYLDIQAQVADLESLRLVHAKKTGALIRAAVRMGAMAAGANADQLARAGRFGDSIGLAFQVHDDVLDSDQDAGTAGPPSYVRLLGLEGAKSEALRLALHAEAEARGFADSSALTALARFAVERGE